MNIFEKLQAVQCELKAPKGQYNKFGGYKYRSCEDILEAVKPILAKVGAAITICDSIEHIGDRYYIKATAIFYDTKSGGGGGSIGIVENSAYAREPESKKGMDESQITGTASSYARKYALNGLLLIDDTKDADTNENRVEREGRVSNREVDNSPMIGSVTQNYCFTHSKDKITGAEVEALTAAARKAGVDPNKIPPAYKQTDLLGLTYTQYYTLMNGKYWDMFKDK